MFILSVVHLFFVTGIQPYRTGGDMSYLCCRIINSSISHIVLWFDMLPLSPSNFILVCNDFNFLYVICIRTF